MQPCVASLRRILLPLSILTLSLFLLFSRFVSLNTLDFRGTCILFSFFPRVILHRFQTAGASGAIDGGSIEITFNVQTYFGFTDRGFPMTVVRSLNLNFTTVCVLKVVLCFTVRI